jgi:hypothetical protein
MSDADLAADCFTGKSHQTYEIFVAALTFAPAGS